MKFGILLTVITLVIVSACVPGQPSRNEITNSPSTVMEQPTSTWSPVPTSESPTASPPPAHTAIPESTMTTTPCRVTAGLLNICPPSPYENLFVKGMVFSLQGRNNDGTWLRLQLEGTGQVGWVSADPTRIDCGNLDINDLPVVKPAASETSCSPIPTTSIGVTASMSTIQPGRKEVTFTIQRADEGHTFFIGLNPASIIDDNGKIYEFDCSIVNNCAWHQLASDNLPYQIDGVLKQPIDPDATQVTIILKVDRGETGIPYFLIWQQQLIN